MKLPAKDILLVSIQVLLFITCAFHIRAIDFQIPSALRYTGLVFAIIGGVIVLLSCIALNKNLTPFPSPKQQATLITTGIYKYVRHPIYSGVVLIIAGYGVFSQNMLCLIVSGILLALFLYKSKYEEGLLVNKFPEYRDYISHTYALVPGVY